MIIDVRFRPPYKGYLDLHIYSLFSKKKKRSGQMDVEAAQSVVQRSIPLAFKEMEEAGITKALVVGRKAHPPYGGLPNEDVLAFVREYPGRFFAVPAVDPVDRAAALDELERLCTEPEVKAVNIEPGWSMRPMYATDPNLYPIYDFLARKKLPLIISGGGYICPDFSYTDPSYLHRVAKDFPNLKIMMGHGGWPHVNQALAVAYDCDNVYLSPDMYLNIPNMPGVLEYVRAANYYLGERLIFGTAYPARPMLQSVVDFKKLPFDKGVTEKVLYHNAAELFGI